MNNTTLIINNETMLGISKCESLILLAKEISGDRLDPSLVLEFPEDNGHNPLELINTLINQIPDSVPKKIHYFTCKAIYDYLIIS